MIKYTTGFVDKLEDILNESGYRVRYERGNFQSGWCLLDHKRVVVLNKFLNTEGRVNTLVDLIPQLKIDFDKLTLASQKIYDFLTANHLKKASESPLADETETATNEDGSEDKPGAEGSIGVDAKEAEPNASDDNIQIPTEDDSNESAEETPKDA